MRGRVGGIPPETIKFRQLGFQNMLNNVNEEGNLKLSVYCPSN